MSIKVKLTLWYLIIVCSFVALFGIAAYLLLVDGLSRNTVDPWDMQIASIENLPDGSGLVTGFTSVSGGAGTDNDYNIMEIPKASLIERASKDGTIEIQALDGKVLRINRQLLADSNVSFERQGWAYILTSKSNPNDLKFVVATQSERNIESIFGIFKRILFFAATASIFMVSLLGFLLARRMLQPLQDITGVAREMDVNNFRQRLVVDRKDELGELALALNQAFDNMQTDLDNERHVSENLSHELRTPLAIAQAKASLALTKKRSDEEYQSALETVSREISHLSAVIDKLFFLAKSENESTLEAAEIDLRELLTEIASDAELLCGPKNLHFEFDVPDPAGDFTLEGDVVRLRELFLNLIDNAIKYTPPGEKICLFLARQDGKAIITVKDNGIGIAEEHLPNIFKRFYRLDRNGSGLGLAISQRIAKLHGGNIKVESKEGLGSTFTVNLPLIRISTTGRV